MPAPSSIGGLPIKPPTVAQSILYITENSAAPPFEKIRQLTGLFFGFPKGVLDQKDSARILLAIEIIATNELLKGL